MPYTSFFIFFIEKGTFPFKSFIFKIEQLKAFRNDSRNPSPRYPEPGYGVWKDGLLTVLKRNLFQRNFCKSKHFALDTAGRQNQWNERLLYQSVILLFLLFIFIFKMRTKLRIMVQFPIRLCTKTVYMMYRNTLS